MPLVTGWTPEDWSGTRERMPLPPNDTGKPSTRGGQLVMPRRNCTLLALKEALPRLAGVGLNNWGVECTAHTGIPSRRGWSVKARSMKLPPILIGDSYWWRTPLNVNTSNGDGSLKRN